MSRSSDPCAKPTVPNLYLVTIKNLDGTTKTVLKSQPLQGAVSNYELTPDQINALWLEGQADLVGYRGPMPAIIRRRIALFVLHTRTNDTSKTLPTLDEAQRDRARHIALAINTPNQNFLPLDEFENLSADDTQDIRKEKSRKQKQANYAIPNDVLDAALNGDEAIVKMMLEKNAGYLLYHGTVTDFSGRTFKNITPFQAALITGDVEMAEMMKPYFDLLLNDQTEMMKPYFKHLPGGQAEMQKQVTEIFPRGIKAHEKIQKEESEAKFAKMLAAVIKAINDAKSDDLQAVIKAINDAKSDDLQAALSLTDNKLAFCKALVTFRDEFTKLSYSEEIFNPNHLLKAFEAYVDKLDWESPGKFDWRSPDWNKLNLLWRQVIGFVQRFLPANYAQVFAYGLYDIVEDKHRCPRSFNFKYDSDFSFYPLAGLTGLRFNYNHETRLGRGLRFRLCNSREKWQSFFRTFVSDKNSKLSELITPQVQPSCCCLIA